MKLSQKGTICMGFIFIPSLLDVYEYEYEYMVFMLLKINRLSLSLALFR